MGFLDKAYSDRTPREAEDFYNGWAETYDDEVAAQGYVTPGRCAEALAASGADLTVPVLDYGCGTGLSGSALKASGFALIDGFDVSEEMLEIARARPDVYRRLDKIDPAALPDLPAGAYGAICATGVLNPGHAPPTAFDWIFEALGRDGLLAFSLNDHALADGAHEARLRDFVDCGAVEVIFKEYGPHLPGVGLQAMVYVVRKS